MKSSPRQKRESIKSQIKYNGVRTKDIKDDGMNIMDIVCIVYDRIYKIPARNIYNSSLFIKSNHSICINVSF